MTRDQLEARLRATEIALDCLLAEIDELRDRLDAHARICPNEFGDPGVSRGTRLINLD